MLSHVPESLAWAHPLVQEWFINKFGTPTEPQEQGWPHILAGRTTLDLRAHRLRQDAGSVPDLYRSPGAQGVERRSCRPYRDPLCLAAESPGQRYPEKPGRPAWRDSRPGRRTRPADAGDSHRRPHRRYADDERAAMLEAASAYSGHHAGISLHPADRGKSRAKSARRHTVIVDEIHAVADDKRGAHLALSLERLDALAEQAALDRSALGLSATQKPIETLRHFLTGAMIARKPADHQDWPQARVGSGHRSPERRTRPRRHNACGTRSTTGSLIWSRAPLHAGLRQHAPPGRTCFASPRPSAWAKKCRGPSRQPLPQTSPRCGAASEERRDQILVATASLELGIDIGDIDLVCQISSPRSIARCPAARWPRGPLARRHSQGRLFATTRDDLIECAALVRAIRAGELDRLDIPDCPLDILTQQIVACCAAEEWGEDALSTYIAPRLSVPRPQPRRLRRPLDDPAEGIASQPRPLRRVSLSRPCEPAASGRRGSAHDRHLNGGASPKPRSYTVIAEPEGVSCRHARRGLRRGKHPAMSCCWATRAGASVAWKQQDASWWKTPTARRPTFLSGSAKRRDVPKIFRDASANSARQISDLHAQHPPGFVTRHSRK